MKRSRDQIPGDIDAEFGSDTSFYESEHETPLFGIVGYPVAESTRIKPYHERLPIAPKSNPRFITNKTHQVLTTDKCDDDQAVPSKYSEVRVVEGCEAKELNIQGRSKVKTTATSHPSYTSNPLRLTKRTQYCQACTHRPRASTRHPLASSTMIDVEEDELELSDQSTGTSVVTWTIHEDSELIHLEDSYMRKIDNKLVPVFGYTAKNSYANCSNLSEESLKYEDGRTSITSSDKFQSQSVPLMNSTRHDFHCVPEPEADVFVHEEVTSMFEDLSHVTPENPLFLEEKPVIKKPTKTNKFSNIFKQNHLKQSTHVENSQTKRELFSRETLKKRHALGKIRIMKKLKQFGDNLRSNDKKHLQPLAIL